MSFADALRVHALEGKVAALEGEVVALRRLVAALTSPQRLDPGPPPPAMPVVDPEPPKNAPNGEYQKWLARREARRGARSNAA